MPSSHFRFNEKRKVQINILYFIFAIYIHQSLLNRYRQTLGVGILDNMLPINGGVVLAFSNFLLQISWFEFYQSKVWSLLVEKIRTLLIEITSRGISMVFSTVIYCYIGNSFSTSQGPCPVSPCKNKPKRPLDVPFHKIVFLTAWQKIKPQR